MKYSASQIQLNIKVIKINFTAVTNQQIIFRLLANTWGSSGCSPAIVMMGCRSVRRVLRDLCGSRHSPLHSKYLRQSHLSLCLSKATKCLPDTFSCSTNSIHINNVSLSTDIVFIFLLSCSRIVACLWLMEMVSDAGIYSDQWTQLTQGSTISWKVIEQNPICIKQIQVTML